MKALRQAYEPLFRNVVYPLYESGLMRRDTLRYLAEYEQNQWLPAERIQALQWRKLQALIAHCWERVPFYRDHWGRAGMSDPAEIRSLQDYARLPVLTKRDLREDFERLKADGIDPNKLT